VIRNEAENAVEWMLEKALYSSINVTATNPRDNDLYVIWVCENSNSSVVTTYAFARKGEAFFFDIMVED
jgi:phage gp46-like protein